MGLCIELGNYVKQPKCTCGAAERYAKMNEEDKVHQFLMGLDDDAYSNIRSQILALDPLPSLDKIYSMVQQEENHKKVMQGREHRPENASAFAVSHFMKAGQHNGERLSCKHCGKTGHEKANCFELIGYPTGWNSRGGRSGRGRGRGSRGGGRANPGRGQRAYPGKEHVHAVQGQENNADIGTVENHRTTLSRLTEDQVQKLLSLIEAPKDTQERLSGKDDWILDSGASYHMTGDLKSLSNLCDIPSVPFSMPNGTISFANKLGSVKLNDQLVLSDVLYVPSLNCNLISIAQLIEDLCCTVTFTRKLCVIQDHTTTTLIGSGEHRRGVYFYKKRPTTKIQANHATTPDLWHRRMGHPSNQALSKLSSTISDISGNKKDLCDVCLRAKQTRLPFGFSDNKALMPFDLVHFDIWGPYYVKSFCGASYFLTILDDATRCVWVTL